MGCDIHAVIEYADFDMQLFAIVPLLPRNYAVFSAMADVRTSGDVTPVATPRGLPADAAWNTKKRIDDGENHSLSWLTADEFAEALRRADAEHPEYLAVLAALRALGPTARLVFGFDN
jgi:hypothetical protein